MLLETIRACIAAVILLAAVPIVARAPAQVAPITTIKNIVLVHGAWVDGSGWKPVDAILANVCEEQHSLLHMRVWCSNRMMTRRKKHVGRCNLTECGLSCE